MAKTKGSRISSSVSDQAIHPPVKKHPMTAANMGKGADNEPHHPPNGMHKATNPKGTPY